MEKNYSKKRLHSEKQSPSSEETNAEKIVLTCEPSVKNEIFDVISSSLSCEEWPLLGIKLGLDTVVLTDLQKDANINKHRREFTIFRMLEIWQQRVNLSDEERDRKLKIVLADIGRNDIATKIQEENDDPDFLKKIQEVLKKMFKDLTLPTSVWLYKKILPLDELFVELTMNDDVKRGGNERKDIKKEEVFLETEKGIPKRILVEGQPGYGKTTLVAKFLSDWANGKKYLVDRFDLVFVIALRNYMGNLRVHLLQQCERVKTSEEHKMRVIESIKERVLLLLDGFDEIPSDVKEKISPLIMGDEYPEMTVVVTCRVGFLQLETKSDNLFQPMKIKSLETKFVWDKKVKIKGISRYKRKEFLQKYLKVSDEKLEEQFSQTNLELNDLYECPLFLLLLAVLVHEKDIHQIKTKTELYKTIVNFVINRGLEKLKGNRKEINVFDLKSESDEFHCRNLLFNFSKLCLEKIKKQKLNFDKSELLKCSNGNVDDEDLIFKLGFLSKQVNFVNYELKEYYEPIHRSFLEFLAAFYLSLSDEMENEIQELVSTFNIWPDDDQLLYPFLGGLLHSNAFKMFNAFSAFKHLITIFRKYNYHVKEVLLEIPETEENLKSLENLAIGNWGYVHYQESLHLWFDGLMKNRSEEIFLNIPENLDIINGVSDDIKVNTIRVYVDEFMKKENMVIEKNIHCQNLIITYNGLNVNTPIFPKEMSMIKAEKVWLKVMARVFPAYSGNLGEQFCKIFYENLRRTVGEQLIERFPEELAEGIGSDVCKGWHDDFCEKFKLEMSCKIFDEFVKDNLVDSDEEIAVELDQCLGDDIKQKLGEEICEKFGEKLNEISRDMLEDNLFDKFYKKLNYMYKYIGQKCCRFFGWELRDLLNKKDCEIISENLGENADSLLTVWYSPQIKDVLKVVEWDEVELNVDVFDENLEIDRKYKSLGEEICIQLGIKKIIVDTLCDKIFCLIAIETFEKFHEILFQRKDKKVFFLFKEYLVKPLKWLNEAELPFDIYHLSLSDVTHDVFRIVAPHVQDLIQKKKIEHGIKIHFTEKEINDSFIDYYNSFVEIVSNSHLKSIGIDNSFLFYPLPFPLTLFNKEKHMEFIGLKASFKGINVDEMKSVSVDHFECVSLRLGEEKFIPQLISTFTKMKKLSCDCDLICNLGDRDSISERKQLKTIDKLEILIGYRMIEKKESFLKGISLFHNVRELGLLTRTWYEREFNIEFIARLPSLKTIYYYGENCPNEFFKNLLDLKFEQGKNELRLDAVEFQLNHNELNISEKDIEDIELCFRRNIFHKFSIINVCEIDFRNVLKHFISKREFNVYCQWKEFCYVKWCDDKFNYCIDYNTKKVFSKQLNVCLENVE